MRRTDYGFRYADTTGPLMVIRTIGWESTTSDSYRWDGRTRGGKFTVFQYTLSGAGYLIYGGKEYAIPANHGFFVQVPDAHSYYYRSDSGTPWEFIFLTAEGQHVFPFWNELMNRHGPVVLLKPNAQPIEMLWDMLRDAQNKAMPDKYDISLRLYEWIVCCLRTLDGKPETGKQLPDAIVAAQQFMAEHYHRALTLEEIAQAAGTSKYHFCRLYAKHTGATPIEHLTRIRVEEAARMLRQTGRPVAEIAVACGFDNSSYFGKVFRRLMEMSPQQFRDGNGDIPDHAIIVD